MANNNRNMQRRAAKQRAQEYKEAMAQPGADKKKLRQEYRDDKRNRKRDEKAKTQLNLSAWRRKNEQKKYDRAKKSGNINADDHRELLDNTGAFDKKNIAAYENYQKGKRNYAKNPGSLATMMGID